MLWNKDVLFIHVPKTGGMSVTNYLERVLEPPIFISVPEGHEDPRSSATFVKGFRHERLHEAEKLLAAHGRTIDSFRLIIAGMRNPYAMEVSRYHHIRKHFLDQPLKNVKLIKEQGFEGFVRDSNFYGRNPPAIEEFYSLRGELLPNMQFFKNENIEDALPKIMSGFADPSVPVPHENITEHGDWRSFMTPEAEEAIFSRFRWMFDHCVYGRLVEAAQT